MDYELISTGGTLKHLKEQNIPVIPIDEITGFPECLDGGLRRCIRACMPVFWPYALMKSICAVWKR